MAQLAKLLTRPLFWFAIALVIRLLYLTEQSSSVLFAVQFLDEKENADAARMLLAGHGFGPEPLFKAPLYPLITAAVMAISGQAWIYLLRFIQHLLGAILVVIAYDSAARLFGSEKKRALAGTIAAIFLTLHAPMVRLEDRLILDFLTAFFQSAMLWALIRMMTSQTRKKHWAAVAGAFAAIAWLTRPTITPLIPLIAISFLLYSPRKINSRTIARAALFLLLPSLAMVAVTMRNAAAGEGMVMPWQGGYNFYQANSLNANGRYMLQPEWIADPGGNPTKNLMVETYRRNTTEKLIYRGVNKYWFNRGLDEIRSDPARWLGLCLRKAIYMVSDREIFNFEDYSVQRELSLILRILPGRFGLIWPLALASLVFCPNLPRNRRKIYAAVWAYAIIMAALIALYYTSGRLRMPIVFPAIILAACGITLARDFIAQKRFRRIMLFAAMIIVGLILSFADWWGVRSENLRHMEYMRLSSAAFTLGRHVEALEYAERAEAEQPGLAQIPQLKAQALYGLGQIPAAIEQYRQSMQLLPNDPVAPYNIGVLLEETNPAEALPYYQEALRRNPNHLKAAEAVERLQTVR